MRSINKFVWSGAAVVLAAVLAVGITIPRAEATTTITASSPVSILVLPAATTTSDPKTVGAYPGSNIVLTTTVAPDFVYTAGTAGNIVVSLPSGWSWVTAPTVSTTQTSVVQGAVTISGANLTIAEATAATAGGAVTIVAGTGSVRANGNTSVSGSVTLNSSSTVQFAGAPLGAVLGAITATFPGTLTSGSVPRNGGFGLVVFGGGTTDQLLTASNCPRATAAFWATTAAGAFVVWVPGTDIAAVNADFLVIFLNGNVRADTALIGKCV